MEINCALASFVLLLGAWAIVARRSPKVAAIDRSDRDVA
jgi:hypothetical protein